MKVDILDIGIDSIFYSKSVNTETLYFDELMKSVYANGVLVNPIVLKEDNLWYRLEDGHLRVEALKRLGANSVKAVIITPEEHEDDEIIKKKIDNMALPNYTADTSNKLTAPYFEQPQIFLNLSGSLDKIREDFNLIQSHLIASNNLGYDDVNKLVAFLQNKSHALNDYIEQRISFMDISYNMENMIRAENNSDNIYLTKIIFSRDYLEQALSSSNNVAAFCNYLPNQINLSGEPSVLSDYVSKIIHNMAQTNENLNLAEVNFTDLSTLRNKMNIDNKVFKLRNLNTFTVRFLTLSNEESKPNIQHINFNNSDIKIITGEKRIHHISDLIANVVKPYSHEQDVQRNVPNMLEGIRNFDLLTKPLLEKQNRIIVDPVVWNNVNAITALVKLTTDEGKSVRIDPVVWNSVNMITALVKTPSGEKERGRIPPAILDGVREINALIKPSIRERRQNFINSAILDNVEGISSLVRPHLREHIREPGGDRILRDTLNKAEKISALVQQISPRTDSVASARGSRGRMSSTSKGSKNTKHSVSTKMSKIKQTDKNFANAVRESVQTK